MAAAESHAVMTDVSRPRFLPGVRRHHVEPVVPPVEGPSRSKTADDLATGSTHVFRLAPGRRRIALLAAGMMAAAGVVYAVTLFAVAAALPVVDARAYGLILLPFALMFLSSSVVLRAERRIRLELGPDGLALYAFGSVAHCRWSDVSAVAPVRWGMTNENGLILTRPATLRASRLMRWLRLTAARDAVPLAPFAQPLAGSALESELRRHCPRLFASEFARLPSAHA